MEASAQTLRTAGPSLRPVRGGKPLLLVPKTVVVWAVTSLILSLALCLTVPSLFGYTAMSVLSGSMEPNLNVGGVVLSKRVAPLDARIGDVVTFKDPGRASKLVSHRLVGVKVRGETAYMTTKGDANDAAEHWALPLTGEIGIVGFHVPRLGYLQQFLNGKAAHIGLLVLLVGLGVLMIVDIWRPKKGMSTAFEGAAGEPAEEPVGQQASEAPEVHLMGRR